MARADKWWVGEWLGWGWRAAGRAAARPGGFGGGADHRGGGLGGGGGRPAGPGPPPAGGAPAPHRPHAPRVHHAGPGAGLPQRAADPRDAGPDAAVIRAARRGDDDAPAADLPGHLGRSLGQRGAVRDEDDPYPYFVAHALS